MLYEPGEDSFLLAKAVKTFAKGDILEVGIGTGIQLKTASEKNTVTSITGIDIQKAAVDHCKKIFAKENKPKTFLQSNLFIKIPPRKFDTIIFNPPYLPEQKKEDLDTKINVCGGKNGYEIIEHFFESVSNFLKKDGVILLLFSNLTNKNQVNSIISSHLFEKKQILSQKMFFEELYVYTIKKSPLLKKLEEKEIKNISPFAQGHRGRIFTGEYEKQKVAIKIQRNDIDATETINNEAKQLKKLNKYNIGPKILFHGKDFFVYSFVKGEFILDFLKNASKKDTLLTLNLVLDQMHTLDSLGLNKEEMHHPVKHIIINKNKSKPELNITLLDFERCKPKLKVHNVTQFLQFISSTQMIELLNEKKIYLEKEYFKKISSEYSKQNKKITLLLDKLSKIHVRVQ